MPNYRRQEATRHEQTRQKHTKSQKVGLSRFQLLKCLSTPNVSNLDYINLQVQMVKLQAKMALIDAHVDRNKVAYRALRKCLANLPEDHLCSDEQILLSLLRRSIRACPGLDPWGGLIILAQAGWKLDLTMLE